jgi:uncharacterized GH25 family protein
MKKLILLSFILSLFVCNANAHGVHVDYSFNYPVAKLNVYFSKTSPVKNADILIFAPDSDELFTSGKTDFEGNFEFEPNVPGDWTVKVDDGLGHRRTSVISIADFSPETEVEEVQVVEEDHTHIDSDHHHHDNCHIPMIYKLIFGLAIIFGISGFWYGLKSRKK